MDKISCLHFLKYMMHSNQTVAGGKRHTPGSGVKAKTRLGTTCSSNTNVTFPKTSFDFSDIRFSVSGQTIKRLCFELFIKHTTAVTMQDLYTKSGQNC